MTPDISGNTRLAGVIGSPIRHSLSPAIFNAAFRACDLDWVYLAFEVSGGHAAAALDAMRALDLGGLSVTMPHKDDIARLVDRRTPEADALDAVNCVTLSHGELLGANTDGAGFLDAIATEVGFDPRGRCAVVFGAGGAARAIVFALGRSGAAEVVVVNRTSGRGEVAAALAGAVGRTGDSSAIGAADLVVNATSVGMGDGQLPFDPALLAEGQVVADIVYHPSPTPLVAAARQRGLVAVDGLGMLVHQAAHAFRLWTGEDPPIGAMRDAAVADLATRPEERD